MTNKLNGILVLIAVFGISVIAFLSLNKKDEESSLTSKVIVNIERNPTTPSASQIPQLTTPLKVTVTEPVASVQAPTIKTYSTTVNYKVPEGGSQSMGLTVTVNGAVISSISISQSKSGENSKKWQNNFENNYRPLVLGKNIKSVNLSRVGGASITTNAFNQAIKSIANQL
jgi:hypothetical protein